MKFSERKDLKLEESSITTDDYERMRKINRFALVDFLKKLNRMDIDEDD